MPRAKKSALQSVLRRRRIRRRRYKTHECDFNFIPCRAKISRLATTKNRRETRSGSTRASGFRSFYIIQGSISPACLRKVFTPTYPKCTKRQSSCQCICLLSGSLRAKAACKLPTFYMQPFYLKMFCAAFLCMQFGFVILWQKNIGAETAHKMLMKLTTRL